MISPDIKKELVRNMHMQADIQKQAFDKLLSAETETETQAALFAIHRASAYVYDSVNVVAMLMLGNSVNTKHG